MTYAFSRDDAGSFLPAYLEQGVLADDPTPTIDEKGVGFLMRYAAEGGRKTKPKLKIGICGEQGGDPATIDFCYRIAEVHRTLFAVPCADRPVGWRAGGA